MYHNCLQKITIRTQGRRIMTHKASGKNYRKVISLIELFQIFPDDATAEKWFEEVRWPDGIHCPHCGNTSIQTTATHASQSYRCRKSKLGGCGKRFSVKTGTVMQESKLGLQKWAVATYLLTTNLTSVSSMKLHRDLKITQKTAWSLAHKIRKSFEQEEQNFNGIAEADGTYVSRRLCNNRELDLSFLDKSNLDESIGN